jgi:hypothetical protein
MGNGGGDGVQNERASDCTKTKIMVFGELKQAKEKRE